MKRFLFPLFAFVLFLTGVPLANAADVTQLWEQRLSSGTCYGLDHSGKVSGVNFSGPIVLYCYTGGGISIVAMDLSGNILWIKSIFTLEYSNDIWNRVAFISNGNLFVERKTQGIDNIQTVFPGCGMYTSSFWNNAVVQAIERYRLSDGVKISEMPVGRISGSNLSYEDMYGRGELVNENGVDYLYYGININNIEPYCRPGVVGALFNMGYQIEKRRFNDGFLVWSKLFSPGWTNDYYPNWRILDIVVNDNMILFPNIHTAFGASLNYFNKMSTAGIVLQNKSLASGYYFSLDFTGGAIYEGSGQNVNLIKSTISNYQKLWETESNSFRSNSVRRGIFVDGNELWANYDCKLNKFSLINGAKLSTVVLSDSCFDFGGVLGINKGSNTIYAIAGYRTIRAYKLNSPPFSPVLTSPPTVGSANTPLSFTTTSTDPDNDTLRYLFDWNSNGIADVGDDWIPASTGVTPNYVASGIAQTISRTWAVPGAQTFRVYAQDSKGAMSVGFATHTINISAGTLKMCPISCTAGGTPYNTLSFFSNTPVTLHACFGTGSCTTGDVPVTGTWAANNTPNDAISLSATSGTSTDISRTHSGSGSASEDITLTYNAASVTARATVSCLDTTNYCAQGAANTCSGETYTGTYTTTCGVTGTCNTAGTRYCDFNWKEVAPGQ